MRKLVILPFILILPAACGADQKEADNLMLMTSSGGHSIAGEWVMMSPQQTYINGAQRYIEGFRMSLNEDGTWAISFQHQVEDAKMTLVLLTEGSGTWRSDGDEIVLKAGTTDQYIVENDGPPELRERTEQALAERVRQRQSRGGEDEMSIVELRENEMVLANNGENITLTKMR